jgi:hypothetical protein
VTGAPPPGGDEADPGPDPQDGPPGGRSKGNERLPPGVDALQAAAREAIVATRALLDVAEALVDDPEMVERMGAIVRAAAGAATRAARSAGGTGSGPKGDDGPDDGDGVQRIPVG